MPAVRPSQQDQVVEVWRVSLQSAEGGDGLRGHLSPDELERLQRLRGSEVGRRWLVSRGALREILAQRLGVGPAEVRLRLDEHGRPRLDPGAHGEGLDFNLSHSADLALVATVRGSRVGIDVERLRPGRNPMRVADRYFSAAEVAALRAFPPDDRPAAFLRYWTAKEALAKGLGLGLQAPRGELELAVMPGGTMVPVRLAQAWRLVELTDLPAGYSGALAVDDGSTPIVSRDWRPGG
jgi:4'-phosphopantetheinyl transferase